MYRWERKILCNWQSWAKVISYCSWFSGDFFCFGWTTYVSTLAIILNNNVVCDKTMTQYKNSPIYFFSEKKTTLKNQAYTLAVDFETTEIRKKECLDFEGFTVSYVCINSLYARLLDSCLTDNHITIPCFIHKCTGITVCCHCIFLFPLWTSRWFK